MSAAMNWAPLALLFLAAVAAPSQAQTAVSVAAGAPLRVECAVRVAEAADWRLDGRAPPADMRASERAAPSPPAGQAGQAPALVARLEAAAARVHHAGLYSCGPAAHQRVQVSVLPRASDAGESEGGPLVYWDVGRALELTCNITNPDKLPVVWSKNSSALSTWADVSARAKLEDGGAKLLLPQKTHEDDFGNYSCAVGGSSLAWRVHGRPHAKLPPNTNVVEGQKLKLTCRLVGKPYPAVAWLFSNDSGVNGSWLPVDEALGARAVLSDSEQGVEEGELTVAAAALSDAGRLACVPLTPGLTPADARADAAGAAVTVLRVKDMYAALWPFLGICAEVFVLCAIILIYEKRRTKPELDDSDTDNHDQKKS